VVVTSPEVMGTSEVVVPAVGAIGVIAHPVGMANSAGAAGEAEERHGVPAQREPARAIRSSTRSRRHRQADRSLEGTLRG
jgi:hypothetical protein